MHLKKSIYIFLTMAVSALLLSRAVGAEEKIAMDCVGPNKTLISKSLAASEIAKQLGWVEVPGLNRCNGYYIEEPFLYPETSLQSNVIQITSNQALFSQHGTSVSEGKVTITRGGQQIIANKAYVYRDPTTGKLTAIDLIGHVTLREPNDLVIAQYGRYERGTQAKILQDILYRTAIYSNPINKPKTFSNEELHEQRKVTQLTAWGKAKSFTQTEPEIYNFEEASYTTCPPLTCVWQVKAKHIELNKTTGRGVARDARLLIKGVPILYTPYFNFPIDARRQTGFLWPTFGTSSKSGPYFNAPFYWNMAPNYDSTITPGVMVKRGLEISDLSRYLTHRSSGDVEASIVPNDKAFAEFQEQKQNQFQSSTDPIRQANLNRLENASTSRGAFKWVDQTRFDEHWSGDVDFNYVSDDYYLRDLSNNLDEVTQNQLLQQAEMNYKAEYWKFIGRFQGYQTLHPIDDPLFKNQYSRLPQLVLEGDYPDERTGLDYFIDNDLSYFDIRHTPGLMVKQPIGNRLNIQPGISRPMNWSFLSITPRLQFAMTKYQLGHVLDANPKNPSRSLPIFDLNTELYFDRDVKLFRQSYRQTLEPQIYYTYIPFRNQDDIPIFDTTLNTLTYDQLFAYNRFSGLDRIGDANQVGLGLMTRFIDQQTGYEKVKAAIGELFYFQKRRVTLCSNDSEDCPEDNPILPDNTHERSPIAGMLYYSLTPCWNATANIIWDPKDNQFNNQTITLQYQPSEQHVINLGYSYVRAGDQLNDVANSGSINLSETDISFAWSIGRDWSTVGRWTENWNHHHFQNLLYGLQYDACCWAVRFVTGRTFVGLSDHDTFQYNTQFYIQFALKGLGNLGSGDPSQTLTSSVPGYQNNFGRDF